jgi:hypothetical protein
MKTIGITIIVLFLISISACFVRCKKSNNNTCKYVAMPSSLILKISKSGIPVTDIILSNCKLNYLEANEKKYVTDFTLSQDVANQNKGLIASRLIGNLSADKGIKTFYLEYPNGWTTDTLYVDYLPHTPATNCLYIQNPLQCNGQLSSIDNSFQFDSPVYKINKN